MELVDNSAVSRRWSRPALKTEEDRAAGYLVAVGSRTARFRRQHSLSLTLVPLLALLVVLIILVIVLSLLYSGALRAGGGVCVSRQCVRSAANLALSMDTAADPCTDFYQFACGRWSEEHPRPDAFRSYDWFRDKQGRVYAQIRDFLSGNVSAALPLPVHQAKTMYDACMDLDTLEKLGLSPAIEVLRSVGLGAVPEVLNLTGAAGEWSWVEGAARVKAALGMDTLIGFDIFTDPRNSSRYRLAMGAPETSDPFPSIRIERKRQSKNKKRGRVSLIRKLEPIDWSFIFNEGRTHDRVPDKHVSSDDDHIEGEVYKEYYGTLLKIFAVDSEEIRTANVSEVELEQTVLAAAELFYTVSNDLYELDSNNDTDSEDLYWNIPEYSVRELEAATGAPPGLWAQYLQQVFASAGVQGQLDLATDKVLVSPPDLRYLSLLVPYIAAAPPHTIQLYVWLKVVEVLAAHTTAELRLLSRRATEAGRRARDQGDPAGAPGEPPRALHCATVVNDMLGMALTYAIADPAFLNHTKPQVLSMIEEIKNALAHLVGRARWMDDNTKVQTYNKILDMRALVGFPEWLMEPGALERHYAGLNVSAGRHLANMAGAVGARVSRGLAALHRVHNVSWATDPTEVNAYHTFQENTIMSLVNTIFSCLDAAVPLVMLQYPFFDLGLDSLNYGSLGTILGHEITHGFDNFGRHFDKDGNLRSWWSNETVAAFETITQCFVDQYSSFYIQEVDEYVDGRRTLGENIADNGGVREALWALRRRRARSRHRHPELKLPGLEHFSSEQLFFLSYGNLWCGQWTRAALRGEVGDEHAPQRVRARAALQNMPQFAAAWRCPPPTSICTVF